MSIKVGINGFGRMGRLAVSPEDVVPISGRILKGSG
jgi:hypothetical protein